MIKLGVILLVAAAGAGVARADSPDRARAATLAKFVSWAESAKSDLDKPGGPPDGDTFKWCLAAYEDAIKAGIPPTEPVHSHKFDGTMEEVRNTVCQAGKSKFDGESDKRTAPYRKVLKNDKLSMALKDSDAIVLPGGQGTDDPNKLAAASVWFIDTSPSEHCPDGRQRHRVHRYQFDGEQRLSKTTDHEYCGSPPSSAYH